MPDVSDMDLLRDYQRQGSEEAFAELVRRHVNLVYSAALRHAGIAAHAEEITQAVFVILARKAAGLRPDIILDAWLYETTRWTALSFLRGERRRQWREQEAYMQSTFQESTGDPVWHQLSPLLDEAMSRLGKKEREAVVLRFFKEKSLREVAAAMQVTEAAAQSRVHRALEKLHRYFARRGVSSTTAIIAEAISANSVQAAPVALAKAVSAVAAAKGAAASGSTLTLIKGALKLMAWTKAKTAIVSGVVVLLAAGTTTITVKEIEDHRTYPWQQGQEGMINISQLNQPPQVKIVSSKFHKPDIYTGDKLLGTGVSAQDIVANAYGFVDPARAIFNVQLPARRYDYIACLLGGEAANEKALQAAVKSKFGVVGKIETRDTDVWLLRVKYPNAPALKRHKGPNNGNGVSPIPGGFRFWNDGLDNLVASFEFWGNRPVIDGTGLSDRFDFDLNCSEAELVNRDLDAVNQALDPLGLELVPTNMPIEMLVVEKAK
jgi:uncharacterized protein (TIGR03435 family)